MHNIVDPRQTRLFDPFDSVLTEKTRKRLLEGWPGVFRHVILELMPVDAVSGHFDPTMGRPTRELYSMAGLLLIQEFMDWTKEQALDAYSFNINVHYALNLEPVAHDISKRTLERYIRLFEDDETAKATMEKVTATLVEVLGIKIDKQRLDSTHIFSDMAGFGRTRLMGVAIKRFLTQLKRHGRADYDALDESLRNRYAPGVNQLFADTCKDRQSRRLLRQQVAEDMYYLIKRFTDNAEHNNRDTYKALERIFYEQCDVHEDKVSVKKKAGSRVMQNPSDPDASYDGHKGPGYQAQISETCNPENDVQLITSVIPQTAAECDGSSLSAVLHDLTAKNLLPVEMLADTHYTGDRNVQLAEGNGVELVGPVHRGSGKAKDDEYQQLNIDDFDVDETTEEVVCCPAGHKPQSSQHDDQTGKTKTVMPVSACSRCDFRSQCPVKKGRDGYKLEHTAKDRRLASRRRETATEVFRERYKTRGGIEGTNSSLKRRVGLGRLRVRGQPAVFHSIYMKVTGWNILRAAVCAKMHQIIWERANLAVFWFNFVLFILRILPEKLRTHISSRFSMRFRGYGKFPNLSTAA
jgi:hypothetical protein